MKLSLQSLRWNLKKIMTQCTSYFLARIKTGLSYTKILEELHGIKNQNRKLVGELARSRHLMRKPANVVEAIMQRGIQWFAYEELPFNEQMIYYQKLLMLILQEKQLQIYQMFLMK